jgi:hypothetical protein
MFHVPEASGTPSPKRSIAEGGEPEGELLAVALHRQAVGQAGAVPQRDDTVAGRVGVATAQHELGALPPGRGDHGADAVRGDDDPVAAVAEHGDLAVAGDRPGLDLVSQHDGRGRVALGLHPEPPAVLLLEQGGDGQADDDLGAARDGREVGGHAVPAEPGVSLGHGAAGQEDLEFQPVAVDGDAGQLGAVGLEHHLQGAVGRPDRTDPPAGTELEAGGPLGPADGRAAQQAGGAGAAAPEDDLGPPRGGVVHGRAVAHAAPYGGDDAAQRAAPAQRQRVQVGGEAGPVVVAAGFAGAVGGLGLEHAAGAQAHGGQPAGAAQHHGRPVEPAAAHGQPGQVGEAGDAQLAVDPLDVVDVGDGHQVGAAQAEQGGRQLVAEGQVGVPAQALADALRRLGRGGDHGGQGLAVNELLVGTGLDEVADEAPRHGQFALDARVDGRQVGADQVEHLAPAGRAALDRQVDPRAERPAEHLGVELRIATAGTRCPHDGLERLSSVAEILYSLQSVGGELAARALGCDAGGHRGAPPFRPWPVLLPC